MTVKDLFKRLFRKVLKWFLWAFLLSNIYLLLCKWIMPPVTLTQLGSLFSRYGLKRDYVNKNEIASSAKLAAMASEDQLFPDHSGFDWKSIEKSLQGNARKKKKVAGAEREQAPSLSRWRKMFFYGREAVLANICEKYRKRILQKW